MENGVTRVNTIPYHQLTVFHCHTELRMSIHQAGKNVNKGRIKLVLIFLYGL